MSLLDKSVVLLPPYATKSIYTVVKEFEHKGTAKVRLRHPETGSEHAKPVSQIRIAEDAEIAAGHRIDAHKVFEEWFKFQLFYAKLVYIHGDRIFDFDMSEQTYHCLPVNIAWLTWQERQREVDKLQKQRDSFIKAYEIEIDKSDELQKQVDAVKQLIEEYRDPPTEDKTFQHALSIVADELEQALKGGAQ